MSAAGGRKPRPADVAAVFGYCPMGCGKTLFVAKGGHITCSLVTCPRSDAVDQLVGERETEHVVVIRPTDFTVKHPLRERLDDQLLRCRVHARIAGGDGPPALPGRYRVVDDGERLHWLAVGR